MYTFFTNYSFSLPPQMIPQEANLSAYFMEVYAPVFVSTYIDMLEKSKKGMYLPSRIVCLGMYSISCCVAHSPTYLKLIKPNMQKILCDVIFPQLCFSEEDDIIWKEDPQEYIAKSFGMVLLQCIVIYMIDVVEEMYNPKISAVTTLRTLLQGRTADAFPVYTSLMLSVFNKYAFLNVFHNYLLVTNKIHPNLPLPRMVSCIPW